MPFYKVGINEDATYFVEVEASDSNVAGEIAEQTYLDTGPEAFPVTVHNREVGRIKKISAFSEVAKPPRQMVWYVEGEHFAVPGRRAKVLSSEAEARKEAVYLLELIVNDFNEVRDGSEGCEKLPAPTLETFDAVYKQMCEAFNQEVGNEEVFFVRVIGFPVYDVAGKLPGVTAN